MPTEVLLSQDYEEIRDYHSVWWLSPSLLQWKPEFARLDIITGSIGMSLLVSVSFPIVPRTHQGLGIVLCLHFCDCFWSVMALFHWLMNWWHIRALFCHQQSVLGGKCMFWSSWQGVSQTFPCFCKGIMHVISVSCDYYMTCFTTISKALEPCQAEALAEHQSYLASIFIW